jgi:hypothetical protein
LDLVAHLILRIVSENGGSSELLALLDTEDKLNLETFKFEMYTSFAGEEEAIGLDLIRALLALKEKYEEKQDLFVHVPRTRGERWGPSLVHEKLAVSEGVKRVWVCGPPLMQEQFDRASEGSI